MKSHTHEWETSPDKGREEVREKGSRMPTSCDAMDPQKELKGPNIGHVSGSHRDRLRNMLWNVTTMYDGSLGKNTACKHRNDLQLDAKLVVKHPYRVRPKIQEEKKFQVDKNLRAGLIGPTQFPLPFPVVRDLKFNGASEFGVDRRGLNTVTVLDTHSIPRMDVCIDSVGSATVLTALDANCCLRQVPVREEDRGKTAFVCHSGSFRFNWMPFGSTNAPTILQRSIRILLSSCMWRTFSMYLDDIVVFSENLDDHVTRVKEVIPVVRDAEVKLKLR